MPKIKIYENLIKINITAPAEMIEEARRYEINLSKAAREGIMRAIEKEKSFKE